MSVAVECCKGSILKTPLSAKLDPPEISVYNRGRNEVFGGRLSTIDFVLLIRPFRVSIRQGIILGYTNAAGAKHSNAPEGFGRGEPGSPTIGKGFARSAYSDIDYRLGWDSSLESVAFQAPRL